MNRIPNRLALEKAFREQSLSCFLKRATLPQAVEKIVEWFRAIVILDALPRFSEVVQADPPGSA